MEQSNSILLGTRGSKLALFQAGMAEERLRAACPGVEIFRRVIETRGDAVRDRPISEIGEKGVFTKELEASLLRGEIDIAVHSLKDMPAETGDGLSISGVLPREDPRDALVSNGDLLFEELPEGAVVGTSSLRRRAIVKKLRPDCIVREIRGNVDTRLRKLDEGLYDAVILAAAGLIRSGCRDRIVEYLNTEVFVPSGCQGIIGLETRSTDTENRARLQKISHGETFLIAGAERSFMSAIGGGCSTPMGCFARIDGGTVEITAIIADPEGTRHIQRSAGGRPEEADALARRLAEEILAAGGKEIVDEIG